MIGDKGNHGGHTGHNTRPVHHIADQALPVIAENLQGVAHRHRHFRRLLRELFRRTGNGLENHIRRQLAFTAQLFDFSAGFAHVFRDGIQQDRRGFGNGFKFVALQYPAAQGLRKLQQGRRLLLRRHAADSHGVIRGFGKFQYLFLRIAVVLQRTAALHIQFGRSRQIRPRLIGYLQQTAFYRRKFRLSRRRLPYLVVQYLHLIGGFGHSFCKRHQRETGKQAFQTAYHTGKAACC